MNPDRLKQKTLSLFVKSRGCLSSRIYGGLAHIFMLHRILPAEQRALSHFNRGLAITPETLIQHIDFLKQQGCHFVSMDELCDVLKSGSKPKKRLICLTLDDGYQDNLTFGLPVFEKAKVPVTLYITNCFPNETAVLWWYVLEDLIMKSDHVFFRGELLTAPSYAAKETLFHDLRRHILDSPQETLQERLVDDFVIPAEDWLHYARSLSLSWDEVRQISTHSLVTIGAHTMNHLSLAHLKTNLVEEELTASKLELEHRIGKSVRHFAYPYGGLEDVTPENMRQAAKSGFDSAVLNHPGNVFRSHSAHLMALPRYPLGEQTSREELHFVLNGIRHFSVNGWKKHLHY